MDTVTSLAHLLISDHSDSPASEQSVQRVQDISPRVSATTYFKTEIVWKNAIGFAILHIMSLYGFFIGFYRLHLYTFTWSFFLVYLTTLGVAVGAHRLYTHRAFQASPLLRFFLMACQTLSGQNCMYIWARDHRQHHKYSDTNADPHNSTRGFFFSHIGWLMTRKHPDVIKYGKTIDLSDLEADPMVMFQKKYYKALYLLVALFLPVAIPCYFWNEEVVYSFFTAFLARYVGTLNGTWSTNSAAHMYGMKPYDKDISPGEVAFVSYLTGGEGWHNFHHTYPWDYRAAEFGPRYNSNEVFIEFCEKIGLASNLRSASKSVVEKKVTKNGDGSHAVWGHGHTH